MLLVVYLLFIPIINGDRRSTTYLLVVIIYISIIILNMEEWRLLGVNLVHVN